MNLLSLPTCFERMLVRIQNDYTNYLYYSHGHYLRWPNFFSCAKISDRDAISGVTLFRCSVN